MPSTSLSLGLKHRKEKRYDRERYAVLYTFRDTVKARWLEWNGKVKELQIRDKEKELAYYKKKVIDTEKEIKELKILIPKK